MFKHFAISVFSICLFCGCTLFEKNISKPVIIKFADLSFTATVTGPSTYNAKYVNDYSPKVYADAFLTTFATEASATKNVTYNNDATNADFILKVKYITITEISFTQKISDAKSPNNGQEVTLSKVECNAEIEVFDVKKNVVLGTCNATRNKSEEVTNNRDLGDLVSGSNKDHSKYHTKLMRDNISKDFASDLGRRIFVHLTRKIAKAI